MSAPTDGRLGRVSRVVELSPDIRAFDIETAFAPAAAGAHLKLAAPHEMRSYSIFETFEGGYRIAVKRLPESRGGSAYMHSLREGARLQVAGPFNHFALRLGAPAYLLVAGGIGITAILSHARALARAGAAARVVYGARDRASLVLADQLDACETFIADEDRRIDLQAEIARLAPGGEAYVCGPVPMLEEAKRLWRASGRPMDLLRFETFGASGRWPTAPFRVSIPRLGREIEVAANQSLLQALELAGVKMIFDCRKGECGLCALPILGVDGVVDHRDVFFSDEEKAAGERLCTCVSRVYGASIALDTPDR
jgi:vanillate O-demethylase ferredoxin subunit